MVLLVENSPGQLLWLWTDRISLHQYSDFALEMNNKICTSRCESASEILLLDFHWRYSLTHFSVLLHHATISPHAFDSHYYSCIRYPVQNRSEQRKWSQYIQLVLHSQSYNEQVLHDSNKGKIYSCQLWKQVNKLFFQFFFIFIFFWL